MSTSASPAAVTKPRAMPTWLIVTIAGLFGLFYAYFVWNAIDFLVTQASGTLGLNAYGWFVLLLAAAFPLIAFGAAFAVGWRRVWWEFSRAADRTRRRRRLLARRDRVQRDRRHLDARLTSLVTRSGGPARAGRLGTSRPDGVRRGIPPACARAKPEGLFAVSSLSS